MLGRKGPARRERLILLTLLALVLSFNYELIFTDQVPFFRDLGPYFYPMRYALAESFKAGELPLWDPRTGMGFPLMADFQSGTFYLPHLVFLFLPFFVAIKALFLFHYFAAAIGSYLLCRRWNFPPYLAVIGAILFAFGGLVVSLSNLLNHFQTAVWLPWTIFLWEQTLEAKSWKLFLLFTFVLLLQLLGGSPEIFVMSVSLLFLDGLRLSWGTAKATCIRSILVLAASSLLVLGIAMVQILPTFELFRQSRGYRPIAYGESALWSLHPLSLINLFFIDKEVDVELFGGMRLFFAREIPFFVTHYMGTLAILGIGLWLLYAGRKEKLLLFGLIAVSLILAMGWHTPVFPVLFHYIPLVGLFRFPEKFFFLSYALLLYATLRGLYEFFDRNLQTSRGGFIFLGALFAGLVFLYLICRFRTDYLIRFIAWATAAPPAATLKSSAGALFYLERQVLLVAGILLVLFVWRRGKLKASLFQAVIVGLVFVDLSAHDRPYRFLLDPDAILNSHRVLVSPDTEPSRLFYYPGSGNIHPSRYTLSRPPRFGEFYSLIFGNLLPNTGVFYGFDYMQEIDALMRWPYRTFLGVAGDLPVGSLYRLLGALNVKYLISLQEMPKGGIALVRHFPEYPSWLYRLKRWVPRTYVVPKATEEKNPVKVLERLLSDGFDPSKEVILEGAAALSTQKGFYGRAEIVDYKNQEVKIRASLSGAGILVLADAFYPGWRVYVDGKEGKIFRANVFFRGVPLPAGDHLVEFRYEPRSLKVGLALSLMTLLGVVGFTAFRYFSVKR